MAIAKPPGVFGRTVEWESLVEFIESSGGAKLALVYGRRRQGKTLLLQELSSRLDGFYWQAIEQSGTQNLASFSAAWSIHSGATTPIRFNDWAEAFRAVFSSLRDRVTPVVIDEVGYLIDAVPELPSIVQALLAPLDAGRSKVRLILCGSSFGQMRRLVDAQAPLRGRANLILVIRPFSYRESASFWGLDSNPDAAFCLHALIGGTPAYRNLADATPVRGDIRAWAIRRLLDPRSPLFAEGHIVVNEDVALGDRQLYWGVLAGLAAGHERRRDLAAVLGKPETSLSHALDVLSEAGWIDRVADPLHGRRSRYRVSEPIVRTWRLLVEPRAARLETGGPTQSARVWDESEPLINSRIYGPHLERLAGEWLMFHVEPQLIGGSVDAVGSSEIRLGSERAQVDLVATSVTAAGGRDVLVVGEVKATRRPVGPAELLRLDEIAGAVAPAARRLIVARGGFTAPLRQVASRRSDVILVDLARLYA